MNLVFGQDHAVAALVSEAMRVPIHAPYTALGVANAQGALVGGIVFNGFNGANIEASVYGADCARRGVIRAVMHYVFVQMKCTRLTIRTRRSNRLVLAQAPRLGFEEEAVLKRYFGPDEQDDALVFVLWPETARRWLGDL